MIDKNLQIPSTYNCKVNTNTSGVYPWRECHDIGDSFAIRRPLHQVKASAKKFCQRNKEFKFYVKDMGDHCRVWRVK